MNFLRYAENNNVDLRRKGEPEQFDLVLLMLARYSGIGGKYDFLQSLNSRCFVPNALSVKMI